MTCNSLKTLKNAKRCARRANVFANQLRAGFTCQRQSGAPGAHVRVAPATREDSSWRDAGLPWVVAAGLAGGPANGRASAALASSAALIRRWVRSVLGKILWGE